MLPLPFWLLASYWIKFARQVAVGIPWVSGQYTIGSNIWSYTFILFPLSRQNVHHHRPSTCASTTHAHTTHARHGYAQNEICECLAWVCALPLCKCWSSVGGHYLFIVYNQINVRMGKTIRSYKQHRCHSCRQRHGGAEDEWRGNSANTQTALAISTVYFDQ